MIVLPPIGCWRAVFSGIVHVAVLIVCILYATHAYLKFCHIGRGSHRKTLSTEPVNRATRFENAELRQRESFSLRLGLTPLLTENLTIEPTFGLNGPGKCLVLGVSLPYTFTP